jgi:hypothetical protein
MDPRGERVIDSASRWMGVLGRFQVLAGGLIVLSVLGIAIAYGAIEALPDPVPGASDTTPPLVSLGEIAAETVLAIGGVALVLGTIVLCGGIVLTDAADDLERVVHTDELDQHHLENALRRLRGYYRMELLLSAMLLAVLLAWALPRGWV